MTTTLEKDSSPCPHCGAEPMDDDDLCRFCGREIVPVAPSKSGFGALSSGFKAMRKKIRPLNAEELKKYDVAPANFSDPADPIWDDWHIEE